MPPLCSSLCISELKNSVKFQLVNKIQTLKENGLLSNVIHGKKYLNQRFNYELFCVPEVGFPYQVPCHSDYIIKKSQSPISVFKFPVLYERVETIWNNNTEISL